jgi:hypothetical protein
MWSAKKASWSAPMYFGDVQLLTRVCNFNGRRKEKTMTTMAAETIHREYWAHEICNRKIIWKHPSVAVFFKAHGLKMSEVLAAKGDDELDAACAKCGKPCTFNCISRTDMVQVARSVLNGGARCRECYKAGQVAAALAAKQAAEEAAVREAQWRAEKIAQLQKKRGAVALREGKLFTGEICPQCLDGFLIVRLSSTTQKPFLGCSSFNPHKYSTCRYTQPLAPDLQEPYLEIFRQRLNAPVVA